MKTKTGTAIHDEFVKEATTTALSGHPDMGGYFDDLLHRYAAAVEADGWKHYPDSKRSDYLYYIIQGKNQEVNFGYHANGRWYSVAKELIEFDVIYFHELPAPYQPKNTGRLNDTTSEPLPDAYQPKQEGRPEPNWDGYETPLPEPSKPPQEKMKKKKLICDCSKQAGSLNIITNEFTCWNCGKITLQPKQEGGKDE